MVRNDKCLTGMNKKYHTVTTTSKNLHQERIERDWIHILGDFFLFFFLMFYLPKLNVLLKYIIFVFVS